MPQFYGKSSSYLIKNDIKNSALAMGLVLFVLLVVWLIFKFYSPGAAGIAALIGIVIIIKVAEPFIDLLNRKSNKFYRGLNGEQEIKEVLKQLPDDFFVFQDLNFPSKRGNIDFAVLGPTGLFTVEVKSHKGSIGFNGYEMTLNGRTFPERNILRQSFSEAIRLKNYLKETTGQEVYVKSVLVFSRGYGLRFGLKPLNNVYVVGKDFLLDLIQNQPLYSFKSNPEIFAERMAHLVAR